jgi:rhodanese-related sulfurtransferase
MLANQESIVAVALLALLQASCSGADDGTEPAPGQPSVTTTESGGTETAVADAGPASTEAASLVTVSPLEASQTIDSAPDGLVVLDVRTATEYAEGHIEGATLVDFYAADFEAQLAELDPAVPYVLYCRSGNRSGQTMPMMDRLGFLEVYEIDGGILAWTAASLPVVAP